MKYYLSLRGLYSSFSSIATRVFIESLDQELAQSFRRTLRVSSREYKILIRPDVSFLCALKKLKDQTLFSCVFLDAIADFLGLRREFATRKTGKYVRE